MDPRRSSTTTVAAAVEETHLLSAVEAVEAVQGLHPRPVVVAVQDPRRPQGAARVQEQVPEPKQEPGLLVLVVLPPVPVQPPGRPPPSWSVPKSPRRPPRPDPKPANRLAGRPKPRWMVPTRTPATPAIEVTPTVVVTSRPRRHRHTAHGRRTPPPGHQPATTRTGHRRPGRSKPRGAPVARPAVGGRSCCRWRRPG